MPCSCQSKRQQWEVVTATGKVVFTSASKPTAETVSKRYPQSSIREKAKPGTTTTAK
ncbi:hypothetical protein [Streptomyces halobius]|uniref:Uncharacterized protein n=1 Tax=Streptomyces halobius TaxID=2879846 RepID=A0ABY4MFY2_9ACTN|nr:hypothetical protein [Streptomyces halobius]UQA95624.1 hypothetical protein K9S39_30550 [Streptomyces halobius]